MELKASEVFSIIQSLEARKEWIEDDEIGTANEEELPYIKSALKKFKELKHEITEIK